MNKMLQVLFLIESGLSAFLLFSLQPLISRILLPVFGGSSAVWTSCMLFFQGLLFFGYLLAHILEKSFSLRLRFTSWTLLLLVACFWTYRSLAPAPQLTNVTESPIFQLLMLLLSIIGPCFLFLSATSPLLQSTFSKVFPQKNPYGLYSVSNIGSFLALLSYPFLIEPSFGLAIQSELWNYLFVIFTLLTAGLSVLLSFGRLFQEPSNISPVQAVQTTSSESRFVLACLIYPLLSSALLLGFTQFLSYDISPTPLLWVAPLGLYLLSFILCFRDRSYYNRKWYFFLLAFITLLNSGDFFLGAGVHLLSAVLFCLTTVFITSMVCHGEVYLRRPQPEKLSQYYLFIALGSFLGSSFVAVAAPLLFSSYVEVPICLLLLLLTQIFVITRSRESILPKYPKDAFLSERMLIWSFGVYGLLWFYGSAQGEKNIIFEERNFYGPLRVHEFHFPEEPSKDYRTLIHGRIEHGVQFLNSEKNRLPVSYYGKQSALGLIFDFLKDSGPLQTGVIGLGTGATAAWAKSGDSLRFYEINPLVRDVAQNFFSYLRESQAQIEILLGDARLSLQSEKPQGFHVLVVDAFSSDAIPFHIVTKEAVEIYKQHLRPDGILAFHISNRHFNLEPLIFALANATGFKAVTLIGKSNPDNREASSAWVAMSNNQAFLERAKLDSRYRAPNPALNLQVWTDDFSSTWQILRMPAAISLEQAK